MINLCSEKCRFVYVLQAESRSWTKLYRCLLYMYYVIFLCSVPQEHALYALKYKSYASLYFFFNTQISSLPKS